jgi:hypothetical protein
VSVGSGEKHGLVLCPPQTSRIVCNGYGNRYSVVTEVHQLVVKGMLLYDTTVLVFVESER